MRPPLLAPRAAFLLTGMLLLAVRPALPSELPEPRPAPQSQSPAERMRRDLACQRCHLEVARQWRASYHRRAYSDEDFTRALLREPRPFCRACHAPEADPRKEASGWARDSGVACVSCHLRGGRIVTGVTGRGAASPHPVVRDPRFSGDAACQGCHEFSFPDGHARRRPELMQSTVSEHARSPHAQKSCVGCHMPREKGRRSHRFPGGHDADWLKAALHVAAARPGGTAVELQLTPERVGHMLPTGDLFRRLVVTAAAGPEQQSRYLQRHFAVEQQLPGRWVRVQDGDDRLAGPTTLRFAFSAAAAARPIRWQVRYQRVAHPDVTAPNAVVLDGELVLAEGELPAVP